MKEKLTLLTVLAVLSICLPAQGQPWFGSGTEVDPYLIEDANDMQAIGADPNYWDAHFQMVNDINLAQFTGTQFNIIGNETIPFTGMFDGNWFEIDNFTYDSKGVDYIGLFGYVGDYWGTGESVYIKNLGVIDPNVNAGTGIRVGSLVGFLVEGTISECYAERSSVTGSYVVGGLVGQVYLNSGMITKCYSSGNITGTSTDRDDSHVGGLVGSNTGTITCSYTTSASIYAPHERVGGLAGCNWQGTISRCYAVTSVSGEYKVGGLVGYNVGVGTITNCYSSGDVSGWSKVGGLVGQTWEGGLISNCYSTAKVSGILNSYVGGLVGENDYGETLISDSFWDIETSEKTSSDGGVGKTTTEMKQKSTFTNWDFVETWGIEDNQTYPFLKLTYPVGDLDLDKDVDFLDFAIFADHWLAGVE